MTSRRHFLQMGALSAPLLVFRPLRSLAGVAQAGPSLPATALFADAADMARLRRLFSSDAMFTGLRQRLEQIDRAAERRFASDEIRYNDHLYHILRASNTAQDMAFYYAMTGDEDAARLSAEMVREIMNFPRWDYFLEGGDRVFGLQRAPGAVIAVALASDWLGDAIDDEERSEWLRVMGERGLEPSFLALYGMRYPDRVEGWTMDETSTYFEHRPGDRMDVSNWPLILDRTNLKAVPASALAVGTIAYQKHLGESDDTRRWLEQAVYSLKTFRDLFARDGSYDEGVSYAHYTTLHLAQATAALRRHLNLDLYDLINWPGYVEYLTEMSMPTAENRSDIVNFGDNSTGASAAVPFWVARRSFDGQSQWFGKELSSAVDEWALLWYDGSVAATEPPASPHVWQSDLDWVVARTGYGSDDLVVAMRSGPPSNHEHADRNSIIVKWRGEQLIADPYRPPYSFSDPAWMLRTTAGHSALLIDGQGHQYHDGREGTNASYAAAALVRLLERDDYLAWTSDATPAYQLVDDDVASVTRTVVVLHGLPAVIVLDKVMKSNRPSRIQGRFFGYNRDRSGSVESVEDGFRITRPRASIVSAAASREGIEVTSQRLPIPEETARLHPFAEVATSQESLAPFLVTVLVPHSGDDLPQIEISEPVDGTFDIQCTSGGAGARCRVIDSGLIPEFDVQI